MLMGVHVRHSRVIAMSDEFTPALRGQVAPFPRTGATSSAPGASSIDEADRALAQALVAGDRAAFRALVERESPRIYRTCYRVLGRAEDAEEATQETFVLAFRGLGTFRGDGNPAAWLSRIAVREAWRKSAERSRRQAATAVLDAAAYGLPHDALDPMAVAMLGEERDYLRAAVRQLPDLYRQVVTLRFFAELSVLEVAAATGRPEGTVKAQLHRGLKRLRESLDEGAR
jgi:RNA polymerase sigma-70 factor (ECF subfamily)